MRTDSEYKKELRSLFYGPRESVKTVKSVQPMHSDDLPFNFMHQETMGIKLAPRQLRELTDARSIAIMATTLAHYCKKMCDCCNTNQAGV